VIMRLQPPYEISLLYMVCVGCQRGGALSLYDTIVLHYDDRATLLEA
jgi:hypothetical protein